jgi:hypothetical protein
LEESVGAAGGNSFCKKEVIDCSSRTKGKDSEI